MARGGSTPGPCFGNAHAQWKAPITNAGSSSTGPTWSVGHGISHREWPLAHASPRKREGAWDWV